MGEEKAWRRRLLLKGGVMRRNSGLGGASVHGDRSGTTIRAMASTASMPPETRALLATEFPQENGLLYLNHAGIAPWPRRAAQAVQRFAEENVRRGGWAYEDWLQCERRLREQCRQLLNAPSASDIALLKNTSEALSFVAAGLPWRRGDNVVTCADEFPSNRIPWEALQGRGVELRQVDWPQCGASSEELALLAACDERTRLMTVSSVQYGNGRRLNLKILGDACRERGIRFCVDAIQHLGALPFDVQEIGADYVAADGHKWMLGPEGVALFYCAAERREELALSEYGWRMVQDAGDFERRDWRPADDARRFECGSPNMLGIHALSASLSLLLEIGLEAVSNQIHRNTLYLVNYIKENDELSLLEPVGELRRAGIVSFRVRGATPERLCADLRRRGVFCASRHGGLRFSPHCYQGEEQLAAALRHLEALL